MNFLLLLLLFNYHYHYYYYYYYFCVFLAHLIILLLGGTAQSNARRQLHIEKSTSPTKIKPSSSDIKVSYVQVESVV